MKKTFLYVMMAAAALFTSTLTSCNDDDDVKKNNEQTEAMIDDINQSILNNFVVLDGDNNLAREGLYGGFKDAADTTSFLFEVADAEAAVKFYNALMPDSLVSKVVVNGQNRTLSYTQEGKQYTMTYAPASGENIATITLPDVEGYNKYARTVQLRDHVSDNEMSAAQFKELYKVGQGVRLKDAKILAGFEKGNDIKAYNTIADVGYSPKFYCMRNNGKYALLAYFPEFQEKAQNRNDMLYPQDAEYALEQLYPINTLTTNQCYLKVKEGGYNEYLPTMNELEAIFDNIGEFAEAYNKSNGTHLATTFISSKNILATINELSAGYTQNNVNFATCETKNSLLSTKKVQAYDVFEGKNWVDKNSKNTLSVIYICIKMNK